MKRALLLAAASFTLSGCALLFVPTGDDEPPSPSMTHTQAPKDAVTSPSPSEPPAPSVTPSPTATEAPTPSLVDEFEQALLDGNGVASLQDLDPENLGYWVSGFEPVGRDGVRVFIQAEVADEGREIYGRWAMQLTCRQLPDLQVVVVRDTTGIDSNHFRSRYPLCA